METAPKNLQKILFHRCWTSSQEKIRYRCIFSLITKKCHFPIPSDEMFRAMNKHLKELDNGGYNIGYDGTFSIQRYLSELLYLRQTKL